MTQAHKLLHGKEDAVFGDSGYTGAAKREELEEVDAVFLAKNAAQVLTLFALSNLWMSRRRLMPAAG